jgi:putative colanic acid biosynthesis acetyltransferase WcaF
MTRDPALRALVWRGFGQVAFRLTPYAWFASRRFLLRLFGATVSRGAKVRRTAHIDRPWNVRIGDRSMVGDDAALRAREPITIGDRCTVSQLAVLTTEARDADGPRTGPIVLEDDAWVAADAIVLPGTTIETGAVVGARSTAARVVPAWTVVAGDPASPRRTRVIGNPS